MSVPTCTAGSPDTGSGVARASSGLTATSPTPRSASGAAPSRFPCAAASGDASTVKKVRRGEQWSRIASSSRDDRRALTSTGQASSRFAARASTSAAAQFSLTISTRSPARTPRVAARAAAASTARASAR